MIQNKKRIYSLLEAKISVLQIDFVFDLSSLAKCSEYKSKNQLMGSAGLRGFW